LMPTSSNTKDDDYGAAGRKNTSDPVGLLKMKLPPASWTNAAAITDYFLGLLYPGEGKANLDMDREAAINFLNSDNYGVPTSFALLDPNGPIYDGRVRGMVALLMCLPRFQEQ
jgi:hypothetical protein